MNVARIRAWLMIAPRPKAVRLSTEGVESRKLETPDGTKWIQVADTIDALEPELIEALNAEGGVIRAKRPAEFDDDEDEKEDTTGGTGIPLNVQDPESIRLVTFAQLLANAYRHSTDVAFARLADMFEASTRRQEALERSLESMNRMLNKAVADQLQSQVDAATGTPGGSSFLEQFLSQFLQGKAQAEADKSATNGAAKSEAS
jgi:hypothetical protein